MDKNGDAFHKRLLATFAAEAQEHVQAISSGLAALDKAAGASARQAIVEQVFRDAHSLKGAARAVGKTEIESLCQSLEGVFAQLKGGKLELTSPLRDLLDAATDALALLLTSVGNAAPRTLRGVVAGVRQRLDAATAPPSPDRPADSGDGPAPGGQAPADAPDSGIPGDAMHGESGHAQAAVFSGAEAGAELDTDGEEGAAEQGTEMISGKAAETVRIPVARLDTILFQAEALLTAKLAAQQRAFELREAQTSFAELKRERARIASFRRVLRHELEKAVPPGSARKSDPAVKKLLEYLEWEDAFIKRHEISLGTVARAAELDGRGLGGMADGLLDDVKKTLMLPVATATEVLPRLVREFAHSQGKEVEFSAACGDTEIDRRILEELRDPLIHLIRNSLDHGIEAPEARLAAGKARRGRVDVSARPIESSRIEIIVADDGAGIDPVGVRRAAHKLGLPVADTESGPNDAALLDLVFHSGLSTSAMVTDLSGHGLGLAIVREKVERLGGVVSVYSQFGSGTRFRIVVPLTLVTFHGVLVRLGDQAYIFPTTHVEQVARVATRDIGTVENREVIELGGQPVALARLAEVLDTDARPPPADAWMPVVVATSGGERIAFMVDQVIGEQEVLAKSLGRQLARVRNIAAATVLGNGRVVAILHIPDLLKSARRAAVRGAADAPPPPVPATRKSVLVAEDSITSRQLLKGILEAAGYTVATAVDGLDAYTQLRTQPFDLLVSDVDMPHLDGFELTARVRADQALAQLPVVLVTALDSRADRERGADAGANAYLVKSGFDQDNLLAVIRRLL